MLHIPGSGLKNTKINPVLSFIFYISSQSLLRLVLLRHEWLAMVCYLILEIPQCSLFASTLHEIQLCSLSLI